MDQLLFHSADWRRFLPSLLQLCVHKLVAAAAAENRSAVVQLRGYSHESTSVARDTKAAHKGDAAQGLQGSREWQVCSSVVLICYINIFFILYKYHLQQN